MNTTDSFATAHLGVMRSTVPVRGTAPQLDTLFDAHLGWVAIIDPTIPRVDDTFCVTLLVSEKFGISTRGVDSFCAALEAVDDDFGIVTHDDDSFCVTTDDDDAFEIGATDDGAFCVTLKTDEAFPIGVPLP